MIDIVNVNTGDDMRLFDTQTSRAANILGVQVGQLEYVPENFGIDLDYFLQPDFKFQNESFKAYLVEVLANQGVNVASVIETIDNLFTKFTFEISADETSTGLIAR